MLIMIPSPAGHTETIDFKPVLCGYIIDAQSMIHPGRLPGQRVVHDVRVLMKKSRAVIKLLKSIIDKDSFSREYGAFRETGRIMSSWRESTVHRKLLMDFRKRHPALFTRVKDEKVIRQLLEAHDDPASSVDTIREDLLKIKDILHRSSSRIRFLNMKVPDQRLLLDELERSFSLVSDCYLNARHNPRDVNIHDFRKKTKDLLYQLFFFRSLNPKAVRNLEKKLDQLAQDLGKYNDYAVLLRTLDYKYHTNANNFALDEFAVIVRQEQDRYLMRIWPAAYRIFKPGKNLLI
ncbi:MAG: CHAD domain-containing protein [Bacteroidales bacterium]|nr:CHAD domain-containing protein [Bacteroidales bacterium]